MLAIGGIGRPSPSKFEGLRFARIKRGYSARFKGKYLYLDRTDRFDPLPICRLTWNGKMDNWGFANYKYSSERYDPEEWFFPGVKFVDGTLTGAMKAGMAAYEIG